MDKKARKVAKESVKLVDPDFENIVTEMMEESNSSKSEESESSSGPCQDEESNDSFKDHAKEKERQKVLKEQETLAFMANLERNSAKRFEYLLKQTEIFGHFLVEEEDGSESKKKKAGRPTVAKQRPVLGNSKKKVKEVAKEVHRFEETPDYIRGGEMKDYQVKGLNWMISLHENGINGILADEMGLGKTLQTISLLGYMKHYQNMRRPHLVIAPKSTLSNWMDEIARWCPSLKAICLIGDKDTRREFLNSTFLHSRWDICVTSYDMILRDIAYIKKLKYGYIVIDEAQRIKNENSKLANFTRDISSTNRLLLTGTPLQNDLHELWALLNFLLPDVFNSSEDFDSWFDTNKCLGDQTLVDRLHSILRPFLLRRIKADVELSLLPKIELKIYVGLTELQRQWYRKVLLKDVDVISADGKVSGTKARMQNIYMHLKKVCNHPYLFPGAEPGPPYRTGQHIIQNSGKMIVLDKLLTKLRDEGSRVLIFCQMTSMMDIIEDYCYWKKIPICRLDGNTAHEDRKEGINEFNANTSSKFLYLISTRAGGLGINLATADVVIMYDSDWNPQVDLQAIDRAHRIGQKKQVRIFRLVTENTVEEKVVLRADKKLRLDHKVIQEGRLVGREERMLSKGEMANMIQFGAAKILASQHGIVTDEDIETILARSRQKNENVMKELSNGIVDLAVADEDSGIDSTRSSSSGSVPAFSETTDVHMFEGEDYRALRKLKASAGVIDPKVTILPGKRERPTYRYEADGYDEKPESKRPKKNRPTDGADITTKKYTCDVYNSSVLSVQADE